MWYEMDGQTELVVANNNQDVGFKIKNGLKFYSQ